MKWKCMIRLSTQLEYLDSWRGAETFFTFDLHLLRISSIIPLVSYIRTDGWSFVKLLLCGIWNSCEHFVGCSLCKDLMDSKKFTFSRNDLCSHATATKSAMGIIYMSRIHESVSGTCIFGLNKCYWGLTFDSAISQPFESHTLHIKLHFTATMC